MRFVYPLLVGSDIPMKTSKIHISNVGTRLLLEQQVKGALILRVLYTTNGVVRLGIK